MASWADLQYKRCLLMSIEANILSSVEYHSEMKTALKRAITWGNVTLRTFYSSVLKPDNDVEFQLSQRPYMQMKLITSNPSKSAENAC